MSIYDDARLAASDLLAEFQHGTVQYIPIEKTAGDAPHRSGGSVRGDPVDLKTVARPVSTKYVDGTNIVQSDLQVPMPNNGVEPSIEGFVRVDGKDHKIIEIMPKPASGDPVLWILIVRR